MREQNTWQTILAIPRAFLHGLFGGLFGPPLALGLAVGLIYLATGQLPAFKDVRGADGVRRRGARRYARTQGPQAGAVRRVHS